MKATSTRTFLIFLFIVTLGAAVGGFYLVFEQIKAYAIEVSHSVTDADASGGQIAELQALKQELADREQLVDKANKLFATPDNYQSQSLKDVQKYAQTYGMTILNTKFESTTDGANGNIFVITLQSPVSYTKLLQFLDAIEGNLPKMQVTSVSLGRTSSGSAGEVTTEDIKIGISTR
ncbi:MAG: hypothetical protein WA041_02755 [Candidatus Microsaccharimonas sp.]